MRGAGKLRALLALRRRSDKVKVSLLLFGLAGYFVVSCLVQAGSFAAGMGRPAEYILSAAAVGPALDARMEALRQREGVVAVSRQREYTLTANEKPLAVVELSEQYLSECYGLRQQGAGRTFWVSRMAWEGFGPSGGELRLPYQAGEETGSGTFTLADSLPQASPLTLTAGNSLTLGDSTTLRLMLDGADLSSGEITAIEALGFSVLNREQLLTERYKTELFLTRLRYGLLVSVLALVAGRVFYTAGKKEVSSPSASS